MTSIIQPTFANGVLSPNLYGRVDINSYYNSLKEGVNFIVRPYGGVDNRSGFRFISEAKLRGCRLIDFQFSKEQTYVLEFGEKYIRFYTRGGQLVDDGGQPLEIETPYSAEDVFGIKYAQSADVLTLVHENYPVQQLKRYAEDHWKIEEYKNKNGPFEEINIDENIQVTTSDVVGDITITSTSDIFTEDMLQTDLYIEQSNVDNVPVWETDKSVNVGTQRRAGYNYYEATTSGKTGSLRPAHSEGAMYDGFGGDTGVQWKYLHSGFGVVKVTSYIDNKNVKGSVLKRIPSSIVTTEGTPTHKWAKAAWRKGNGYPSTLKFYKQRMYFAGSRQYPQTVWSTVTGDYSSFEVSKPSLDTDSINFTHADAQLNKIQHLIDVGQLLALTSAGEYKVASSAEGLTPSTFAFNKQGANGASEIMPIMVNDTALYIQNKNGVVRSIGYTFETDGYQSTDLTMFSNHYFKNHQIVDWAFVTYPYSSAFCVRDDGVLLCLTFVKEQQVIGWTELRTELGRFKSVTSISEGSEDVLYCTVERDIDGQKVTYIERMESRLFKDSNDYFFVDSGLKYDGRNTDPNNFLKLNSLTGWGVGDQVMLSFVAAKPDIGFEDEIHIPYVEGEEQKVLVLSVVDIDNLIFTPERDIPDVLKNEPILEYGLAKSTFKGMAHLEGVEVSILGDGAVTAPAIVSNGVLKISEPYVVVVAGIPINSQIQTLSVNVAGNETLLDKKKLITDVTMVVESSRGVFCGQELDRLYEYPQREYEFYDENVKEATGTIEVKLQSSWDKNGSFYIVQKDPLPLSILSIIPNVTIGGR